MSYLHCSLGAFSKRPTFLSNFLSSYNLIFSFGHSALDPEGLLRSINSVDATPRRLTPRIRPEWLDLQEQGSTGVISSLLFWRKVLLLKFQAVHPRSPVDYAIGHLPGFKTQGAAPSRELFIPGDEKILALKAIDFLFFQMARTRFIMCWIYEKGGSISKKQTKGVKSWILMFWNPLPSGSIYLQWNNEVLDNRIPPFHYIPIS